jgi:hypothetical protein
MMETMIAIGIVVLAAAGVGYGLYRNATGRSGCDGCKGCHPEASQYGRREQNGK